MTSQSTFTDGVLIRPATLSDADVVYKFICALEETAFDPVAFRNIYQMNLNAPTIHYFVAEQAGEVTGFISCHTQYLLHEGGRVGEIQELFVRPDKRGQGVGRQLVAKLMDLAAQEKFINVEVTTNRKRTKTVRFYERQSFNLSHYKLVNVIS